jgi:hypothetical protein
MAATRAMQCKDIPDLPILRLLESHLGTWATWGEGYCMPTVRDAMPDGTPDRLQVAKMARLIRRGLASGCPCGCRGDFEITPKGLEWLEGQMEAGTDTPTRAPDETP